MAKISNWIINVLIPKDGFKKRSFSFRGTLWEAQQEAEKKAIKAEIVRNVK